MMNKIIAESSEIDKTFHNPKEDYEKNKKQMKTISI